MSLSDETDHTSDARPVSTATPTPAAGAVDAPVGRGRAPTRSALIAVNVAAAAIIAMLFIWYARDVLLLAFSGVLLAVFLRRLASWVANHGPVSPRWALAVVVVALSGALVGAFWWRGPAIAAEIRTLREELPRAADQLQARIERYELGQRAIEVAPSPEELLPDGPSAIARATGVASRAFSTVASFVIILFLGVVIAATPSVYVNGLLALVPARKVARAREVLKRLYDALWWWLVGRVVAMTFIGVATGVGLWLLGIPLAFPLALLAAVLSFIPNLGPILSAIPALLLALVQSPRQALWVALLYAGIQMVESYAVDPYIDRKTVYLPPALTVLAQLALAVFAGLLGVALATPLTAALVVLISMLYVHDVLGRYEVRVPAH